MTFIKRWRQQWVWKKHESSWDLPCTLQIQRWIPWASPGGGGRGGHGPPPPFGTEWRPPPPPPCLQHAHPHWLNWLKADSIHRPLIESAESADTSLTEMAESPPPPPPPHWLNRLKADSTPPPLVESAESGQRIRGCQVAPPCPILAPPFQKSWGRPWILYQENTTIDLRII